MKVSLVPMIKNKTLVSPDIRNCRLIALPMATPKLFQLILQNRMLPNMNTSDGQFAFKASHCTDMAIFSFKENVKIYLSTIEGF